jgi:hypothetical protein
MCAIPIPNNQGTRKYGKNVELLSSGKPEWIEDLRKYKMRERKPSSESSNYTEPDSDLHSLNGTKKHHTKSQTLRLPAGTAESSATLLNCQPLSLLLLFISFTA